MGSFFKGAAGGAAGAAPSANPYAIGAGALLGGLQGKKAGDAAKGAGRTGMTGLPSQLGGWEPLQYGMGQRREALDNAMAYRPFQNNPFSELLRRKMGAGFPALGSGQGGFGADDRGGDEPVVRRNDRSQSRKDMDRNY